MSKVFLGLGSNLGDRHHHISTAISVLKLNNEIEVTKESSIYETEPYGYINQPNFLNMVVEINTTLSPMGLLNFVNDIEAKLGRKRLIHWGPRTIDIDILLYDGMIIKNEVLEVPHPYIMKRLFVLVPLAEIYSGDIPGKSLTIKQYIDELDQKEGALKKWKV